jgi:hypothetical protein
MKAVATQANEQSTAAEDALRLVVDTTPAFIHTARPDGYLDYFNRGGWIFSGSHSKKFATGQELSWRLQFQTCPRERLGT